jgi:hypothetical protein
MEELPSIQSRRGSGRMQCRDFPCMFNYLHSWVSMTREMNPPTSSPRAWIEGSSLSHTQTHTYMYINLPWSEYICALFADETSHLLFLFPLQIHACIQWRIAGWSRNVDMNWLRFRASMSISLKLYGLQVNFRVMHQSFCSSYYCPMNESFISIYWGCNNNPCL